MKYYLIYKNKSNNCILEYHNQIVDCWSSDTTIHQAVKEQDESVLLFNLTIARYLTKRLKKEGRKFWQLGTGTINRMSKKNFKIIPYEKN